MHETDARVMIKKERKQQKALIWKHATTGFVS